MKRLRLAVFRSNKYIYAQIIDDEKGHTLVSASDLSDLGDLGNLSNLEKAKEVGKILAKKALEKNIKYVWFDRRRYKYHGRVKALAEGAREGGLKF
ncbi:MAG: 50S ribosomal protein L18 [Microgenomates group bacterium]